MCFLYLKGRNTRSFSWCDITESGFLRSRILPRRNLPLGSLESTGWHSILKRRDGGVLVGNNHVISLKREAFYWQHQSGHWSIVFAAASLLRHSRHFGHNIEQFHLMAATRKPKMPVAGLKEGGERVRPPWRMLQLRLWVVVAIPFSFSSWCEGAGQGPRVNPTHTHTLWLKTMRVCEPHIELHHRGVDSRQDVDRSLFGNETKRNESKRMWVRGIVLLMRQRVIKCKGCEGEWVIRTFSPSLIYTYIWCAASHSMRGEKNALICQQRNLSCFIEVVDDLSTWWNNNQNKNKKKNKKHHPWVVCIDHVKQDIDGS